MNTPICQALLLLAGLLATACALNAQAADEGADTRTATSAGGAAAPAAKRPVPTAVPRNLGPAVAVPAPRTAVQRPAPGVSRPPAPEAPKAAPATTPVPIQSLTNLPSGDSQSDPTRPQTPAAGRLSHPGALVQRNEDTSTKPDNGTPRNGGVMRPALPAIAPNGPLRNTVERPDAQESGPEADRNTPFGPGRYDTGAPAMPQPFAPQVTGAVTAPPARRPQIAPALERLSADRWVKRLLASGKMVPYRAYLLRPGTGTTSAPRKSWRGLLAIPDPRVSGTPVRLTFRDASGELLKDPRGRILDEWFYAQPDGSYSKVILTSDGSLGGLFTIAPNGVRLLAMDLDNDRIADLLAVRSPNGVEHLALKEDTHQAAIERMKEWLLGLDPLCIETSGADAPMDRTNADSRATLSPCRRSGGGRSGGPGGGGADAGRPRNNNQTDQLCEAVLAGGAPGGPGEMGDLGLVAGGGGREDYDWGAFTETFFDSLFDNLVCASNPASELGCIIEHLEGIEEHPEQVLLDALGTVSSSAAILTGALGDALQAGGPRFVNEADEALFRIEEANDYYGTNVQPDQETLDEACSAGSRSHFCDDWAPPDQRESNSGNGGGSGARSGSSQPERGVDPTPDPRQALYEHCKRKKQSQMLYDWLTDVTQHQDRDCEDPKGQPLPAMAETGPEGGPSFGGGAIDQWCRGEEKNRNAPQDLNGLLAGGGGGKGCGPTEQPDDQGNCSGFGKTVGGGRSGFGTVQEVLGLDARLSDCDPHICDSVPEF